MTRDLLHRTWAPSGPGARDELLFVGDVHLGRRPVGLDSVMEEQGVHPRELSPAVALSNTVSHALEHRPRAVVFAGDLVDEEEDRFEAYSVLEREVARLREAEVPVFAVAGNHDGRVLPRLLERVRGVDQLGKRGEWERVELPGEGAPVDLVGWSFPGRYVRESPLGLPSLERVVADARPDAVLIGVVHGDLDAPRSRYGPLSRRRLEASPMAGWFLGHVHLPGDLGRTRPIGYLGSLVGLDPSEVGPRGPWRVGIEEGRQLRALQVALSPIRWETFALELREADVIEEDALHERIETFLRERLASDATLDHGALRAVVVRLELLGRLSERLVVRRFVERHEPRATVFRHGGVPVIVQRLRDRTLATVDLDVLALEASPVGRIARRLRMLACGGGDELCEEARVRLEELGDWGLDEEALELRGERELLQRAGWRALEKLLEQREEIGRS